MSTAPALDFAPDQPPDDGLVRKVKILDIRLDAGTQPREVLSNETVAEYAESMLEGKTFPPVIAYHDGKRYWLADGFHRVNAAMRAKLTEIDCRVYAGTQRDAVLFSCGANAENGLRRSNADKRRSVLRMLNDDDWGMWSDVCIAQICRVSSSMVGSLRAYSINPQAQSRFRKQVRNGVETIRENPTPKPKIQPDPNLAVESKPPLVPDQPPSRSMVSKFTSSLRANSVGFKTNVRTELGTIMFLTDTTVFHVEELLTANAFRDAFALVALLRMNHDKKLNAVIVGHMTEEAKPWAVEAKKYGVEVKHFD